MKQCTYSVSEMLKYLENDYQKYISMKRGESYVFAILLEDFNDSDPDEEMIICNLIIANMNLKANHVEDTHKELIKRSMSFYKSNIDRIKGYYDKENLILIDEIVRGINGKRAMWDN